MHTPHSLWESIDALASGFRTPDLAAAAARLSDGYRTRAGIGPRDAVECASYAIVRAPATHAAVGAVLDEAIARAPAIAASASVLDVFAGTGAASWAASERLPLLRDVAMADAHAGMLDAARRLATHAGGALAAGTIIPGDVRSVELHPADMVIASYGLNELPGASLPAVVEKLWRAATRAVVLVEAGTAEGWRRILAARDVLRDCEGARILAPCPGWMACPMVGTESWCHFAQRLPRSHTHRLVKGGTVGFEDEKYAYLVVSRDAGEPAHARVTRPPNVAKHAVRYEACTADGLEQREVPKRDKSSYKAAKKLRWGDAVG